MVYRGYMYAYLFIYLYERTSGEMSVGTNRTNLPGLWIRKNY